MTGSEFTRALDALLDEIEREVRAFVRDYEADRREMFWGDDSGHELTGLRTLIDGLSDPRPWRAVP